MTGIEWTDRTWNPVVGCSAVSPGCEGCYAAGVAHRGLSPTHRGLTIHTPGQGVAWTGEVRCVPDRLDQPLGWSRPLRIFVGSMTDLFHPEVPNEFLAEIFARILLTPRHTYQVLTKRPRRLAGLLADPAFTLAVEHIVSDLIADEQPGVDPAAYFGVGARLDAGGPLLPNLWAGTSIESDRFLWRADHLRATPGPGVRFLSLEPLLGPLHIWDPAGREGSHLAGVLACSCGHSRATHHTGDGCEAYDGIDWVIAGGETGPRARPMHPDWVRDIRDRCSAAGVAFFFKQWGDWAPAGSMYDTTDRTRLVLVDGTDRGIPWPGWGLDRPEAEPMRRFGKRSAGRELDGLTHDAFPDEAGR